jgi:hypothetical protein
MPKITKSPSLTAARGKMTATRALTTPGYKLPQQKIANEFTQSTMRRGSFKDPVPTKPCGPWGGKD